MEVKKFFTIAIAEQTVDGQQVEPALKKPDIVDGRKSRTFDRDSARE